MFERARRAGAAGATTWTLSWKCARSDGNGRCSRRIGLRPIQGSWPQDAGCAGTRDRLPVRYSGRKLFHKLAWRLDAPSIEVQRFARGRILNRAWLPGHNREPPLRGTR